MNGIGYYINLIKSKTKMNTLKKEALERLTAIEVEQKKLRAILEAPEVKAHPTTLEEACKRKGVDYFSFLRNISQLSKQSQGFEKLQLIISVIRGDWKPTIENTWYYPYFKRNKSGFSFGYCGCHYVGYGSGLSV